jgi:flagellar protein FliO/FliZ
MSFLDSLLGGSGSTILNAALALGIVLVLIVLGLWAMKVIFKASNTVGRGRNRRLSITDSLPLDTKRQLLIVRRDNVEHLILTGGTQDIVIESGIPVPTSPVRAPLRRPVQATAAGQPTVAPQPAPAPSLARVTPVVAPPVAVNASKDLRMGRSPLERLRELGRPTGERQSTSLRHTGLLRSAGRVVPSVIPGNPENQGPSIPDSARTSTMNGARDSDGNGHASGGDDDTYDAQRDDGYKPERR